MRTLIGRHWPHIVTVVVLAAIGPLFTPYSLGILTHIAVLTMVLVGLDLLIARASMMSFGQAGLMAVGAYTSVILLQRGWPFWAAGLAGVAASLLVGVLLAIPASRLSGFSFALVTFGFSTVVVSLAAGSFLIDIAGGESGLLVPPADLFGLDLYNPRTVFYVVLVALLLVSVVTTQLIFSRTGRAIRTMRESEHVAAALGIKTARLKIGVFGYAAAIAGIGGVLYAQSLGAISAPTFSLEQSIILVAMLTVGGLGRAFGPIVGATIFVLLPEVFQELQRGYSPIVFAAIFIVMLIVAPTGIVGLIESGVARVRGRRRAKQRMTEPEPSDLVVQR